MLMMTTNTEAGTSFESLANELFLEIFKYLSRPLIYHSFHGLHIRLDKLILGHSRNSHLDLRSISKVDFDITFEKYLLDTFDLITSMCLSDDDDTPGQIDGYFLHGLEFRQLVSLHSILFSNIRSEKSMDAIILDLPYLVNLINLTFEQCYFPSQNTLEKALTYGNSIWSLPKLISFSFIVNYKYRQSHHIVDKYRRDNGICICTSVISSTLKCLSIIGVAYCSIDLMQLFTHTPHLQCLSIDQSTTAQVGSNVIMKQLTELSLSFNLTFTWNFQLSNILRNIPNLNYLKLDYDYGYPPMDGGDWEQIIRNHLPKLQRLEF